MMRKGPVSTLLVIVVLSATGCSRRLKQDELSEVARDWAMTIRASQIIPIYPLREDLEVGDVFLVSTPIQHQQDEYRQKGFLRLDQQVARLPLVAPPQEGVTDPFARFYRGSFGLDAKKAAFSSVPDVWRFSAGAGGWLEPPGAARTKAATAWTRAPRAFFPTYTFKVRSGGGFAAAVPIHSVPLGMAVMGTDAATGSAQIKDAFTYGLSLEEIQPYVDELAQGARPTLESLSHANPHTVFVRVINRAFLAGGISVSLTNDRAFGADLKAGAAPKLEIPTLTQGQVDDNLSRLAGATGTSAATQPPGAAAATGPLSALALGAAIKFTLATARSVTAEETFDRPLVVGYLAFDYPVLSDGSLGVPVATLDQLVDGAAPVAGNLTSAQAAIGLYSRAARSMSAEDAMQWLAGAAHRLGPDFEKTYASAHAASATDPPGAQLWQRFNSALSTRRVGSERAYAALRASWEDMFKG